MFNETVFSNIPDTPVRFNTPGNIFKKGLISKHHIHNEIEILYIKKGLFTAYNDNIKITAKGGETIFINSRVVHATISESDNTEMGLLQFDLSEISQKHLQNVSKYFRRFLSSSECSMYHFKEGFRETEEINECIDKMIKERIEEKKAYELYINAEVCKIVALLHRYNIVSDEKNFFDGGTVERIYPALNYIDTNYQKEITLENLSRLVNLNPYYFCRLFKRATNSTFTEYLNFVRVYKAEKMIVSGKHTISEISSSVGFSSVSYFNRIFKRYKGCTPSAYKKVKYAVQ